MGGLATLAWYNILLLFGVYSLVLSIIARLFKLGHVLGVVFGISLLTAYLMREFAFGVLPLMSPSVCILAGFSSMVVSNLIVDLGVK